MMQRDTQRRDDMAMLVTQLNNYQANNRGQLPHQTSPNKQVEAYIHLSVNTCHIAEKVLLTP